MAQAQMPTQISVQQGNQDDHCSLRCIPELLQPDLGDHYHLNSVHPITLNE